MVDYLSYTTSTLDFNYDDFFRDWTATIDYTIDLLHDLSGIPTMLNSDGGINWTWLDIVKKEWFNVDGTDSMTDHVKIGLNKMFEVTHTEGLSLPLDNALIAEKFNEPLLKDSLFAKKQMQNILLQNIQETPNSISAYVTVKDTRNDVTKNWCIKISHGTNVS